MYLIATNPPISFKNVDSDYSEKATKRIPYAVQTNKTFTELVTSPILGNPIKTGRKIKLSRKELDAIADREVSTIFKQSVSSATSSLINESGQAISKRKRQCQDDTSVANAQMDGQSAAKLTDANNDTQEVHFLESKRSNKQTTTGVITYPNGDQYTGGLFGETRSGQGTYTWLNGDKYVGLYINDKPVGGVFTRRGN